MSDSYAYEWPINLLGLSGRRKNSPVAVASPENFELQQLEADAAPSVGRNGVIYCVDATTERVLYTICGNYREVFQAPLLYSARYEQALKVVSVLYERLNAFVRPAIIEPTMIFSIGRGGSTILGALLSAAGLPAASEPDLSTQLACPQKSVNGQIGPAARSQLVRTCRSNLATHLGSYFAVKLRIQCSTGAKLLAELVPEAKYGFVFRGRSDWTISRFRVFGGNARSRFRKLRRGMGIIHSLVGAGRQQLGQGADCAAR